MVYPKERMHSRLVSDFLQFAKRKLAAKARSQVAGASIVD